MSTDHLVTFFLLLLSSLSSPFFSSSQPLDPSSSGLNHTWINNPNLKSQWKSGIRPIFPSDFDSPGCGFFCSGICDRYLFCVFLVGIGSPQVVWSANRDRMVGENATLELSADGNLILRDTDGSPVWSTNTSGKGVTRLALEKSGNLVLAGEANETLWQSFDHPTDAIVVGQVLRPGMKLVASVSPSNYTEGPYYLSMEKDGIRLFVAASEPQQYGGYTPNMNNSYYRGLPYAEYKNGSIDLFLSNSTSVDFQVLFPKTDSMQFIKLDPDGILRLYAEREFFWMMLHELEIGQDEFFTQQNYSRCFIPNICGCYGLCTPVEQCTCLQASSGINTLPTDSFTPLDSGNPAHGCKPYGPLVCDSRNGPEGHHIFEVSNVDYFALQYLSGNSSASLDECKRICLQDCSCKAAFFTTGLYDNGTCYTITDVYSLRQFSSPNYSSIALIKMQNVSLPPSPSVVRGVKASRTAIIAGTTFGIVAAISLVILGCLCKRKRARGDAEDDEFFKYSVPGLPSRFSFRDLRDATDNFRNRLGSGGFGSVFLGVLRDGSRVAVKRLESAIQGEKEFRTEVCTIGSIHHLNLVRLCGFCAEKRHRLLVYEFMPNGSLDKWLFSSDDGFLLDWDTRFSIALGTAHGLSYLHEGCRERILHLDVKPQNVLLDEQFVAKISDFGLSKLMDRDQSHVVTTMRGTPGYLAPEWLHSKVTEKADVYSFGILLLEIVSGRKCLDFANAASESTYLPVCASRKAKEGKLMELVDDRLGDSFDEEEAERAMRIGSVVHARGCCRKTIDEQCSSDAGGIDGGAITTWGMLEPLAMMHRLSPTILAPLDLVFQRSSYHLLLRFLLQGEKFSSLDRIICLGT